MTRRSLVGALGLLLAVESVFVGTGIAWSDDVPPKPASDAPGAAPVVAPVASAAAAEAKKYFESGDVAREEGRWEAAATAYSKSLDADESNYLAHLRYQEAVIEAGSASLLVQSYDEQVNEHGATDKSMKLHRLRLEPASARTPALSAMLKASPGDVAVLLELGRAQLALDDVSGARKSLEAAYAAKSDFADVLALSVEALRRAGDGAGARARLEAIQKVSPENFECLLRLARLDLAEGKFDNAMKRADAVLGMRPTYLTAFFVKSEAAARLGRIEDARNALDAILKSRPDDPDAILAVGDFVAKSATKEGLEKAIVLYKKVLTIKGASQLRGQYGLAWAYERSNQLDLAATAYREAGLLAPGDAAVVNSIGVVCLKQKKFQDAIVQFKKAIDLDPLAPEAYANMGAVADEQADWNEGIKWYLTVLKLKGQEKNVRALLNCSFDYEAVGNYKKAEDMLVKVRAIRPDDSEIATFLADNQSFQKKWKSAIKIYLEATKLDEKNRFAWRGLGIAYAQDEQEDKAIDALEKAKALKADDATTLVVLGDTYLSKGELEKALTNFEAYVKAGGSNGDIPALIEQLKAQIDAKKK